jgi:hypothetical protein
VAMRDDIFGSVMDIPPQADKEDGAEQLGRCVSLQRRAALFGIGIKRPGLPDKIIEFFDLEGDGDNSFITLIMGARKVWKLDIKGARLGRLLYLLKERKIEWIAQADRPFDPEDGHPFIAEIKLQDVTERERKREEG